MNILVVNNGSSSLKFQLIQKEKEGGPETCLASGVIDRIGGEALLRFEKSGQKVKRSAPVRDTKQALDAVLKWLWEQDIPGIRGPGDIHAVGHRIVHGGEHFKESVRIDEKVLRGIEDCIDLAPLHNPANLRGIAGITAILGTGVPQVAVFDTSYHVQMPERAAMYAIPYSFYRRHKIRRYGFHGTSYRFIAQRYQELSGKSAADTHVIAFHLGNGCSACAIEGGKSIDTSMGMTPVEGLVMGTRSGDIDPAILEQIAYREGMDMQELQNLLNKQSGLLGISGLTNDMRDLLSEAEENKDRRAQLAIDVFCYRARKYLGAYLAAMGRCDAVIFSGGIGENSAPVRQKICEGLSRIGIRFDAKRNQQGEGSFEGLFSEDGSPLQLWVIPTNEEIMIARDTMALMSPKQ